MATKKSASPSPAEADVRGHENVMEERRKAKEEATTVDGTESFPPNEPAPESQA